MLSSLLSVLGSGPPAATAAAAASAPPTGGGGEQQRQQREAAPSWPRRRRASGSFTGGDAPHPSSSPAPPARRPLVVVWPQLKTFLSMADASLRRKTEQVEVRGTEGEREREERKGTMKKIIRCSARLFMVWKTRQRGTGWRLARFLRREGAARGPRRPRIEARFLSIGTGDERFSPLFVRIEPPGSPFSFSPPATRGGRLKANAWVQ
jgi:hypothetical protein